MSDIPTPKTDAAEIRVDVGRAGDAMHVVPGYFAREQERTIVQLVEALQDLLEVGFNVANTPSRQRASEILAKATSK